MALKSVNNFFLLNLRKVECIGKTSGVFLIRNVGQKNLHTIHRIAIGLIVLLNALHIYLQSRL